MTERTADGRQRRRGRPVRSPDDMAEMRGRIAARALLLFQRDGYQAVSMRKLAAELGCTPRTIYAYFDNKFEILSTLWSDIFEALFTELTAQAMAAPDPQAGLRAIARRYVGYWLDNPESYFLVFMSGGISRTEVEGYIGERLPGAHFDLFRQSLARARGETDDPAGRKIRFEALVCALNGIAQAQLTLRGHDWSSAETLVDLTVDACLQG